LEALEAFLPFLTDIGIIHQALAWSAERGRSRLVKRLLRFPGVDVNIKIGGMAVLYLACKSQNPDTIALLLEAGADPTAYSSRAHDESGGISLTSFIGRNGPQKPTRGSTALHAFCSIERRDRSPSGEMGTTALQEVFDLLLSKGALVDQRTTTGRTALHFAVQHPFLTQLLLRAGADANAVDDHGQTPLHFASIPDTIDLLVQEGRANINSVTVPEGRTPLACMLHGHREEAVFTLLKHLPDLSIKDVQGNSTLHLALKLCNNDATVVEALLRAGSDPNERNRLGKTPLLAMQRGISTSGAMIKLFLEHGADVNAKDSSGMTVLSRAIRYEPHMLQADHSDIKALLDNGADILVRDNEGKTLLHHAVSSHDPSRSQDGLSRLDFLLSLNSDTQVVDYCGNTLIHELALRPGMLDSHRAPQYCQLWEKLISLGIDVTRTNHRQKTALHILAATDPLRQGSFALWLELGHIGPLDLVLTTIEDIDQSDAEGLTALHLAATVSEYNTKTLLDYGADPTLATFEGLTPLHLAARARQPNIVGMLLNTRKVKSLGGVDVQDRHGRAPLYYACRSRRPETVRLLLNAGADASSDTLFAACAEFEEEDSLWQHDRDASGAEANQFADRLTINDKTRPRALSRKVQRVSNGLDVTKHTPRIDEIIEMLITNRRSTSSVVRSDEFHVALGKAYRSRHVYTIGSFVQLLKTHSHTRTTMDLKVDREISNAITEILDAQVQAAIGIPSLKAGEAHRLLVVNALEQRQYHVIRPLFEKGVNFLTDRTPNIELFVQYGYTSLLEEIGTLEAERRFKEGKWHAFGDSSRTGLHVDIDTEAKRFPVSGPTKVCLLSTAVKQHLPNMEAIRLLIEKFHVDINQHQYHRGHRNMLEQHGTVLHTLAKGLHWWHHALAIPYLISRGADANAKDQTGCTPLHIALCGSRGYVGPFHQDAARALVAGGANVNAKDDKGLSCLASTAANLEMVQLLLDHHAQIQADALIMAIEARSAGVLNVLLRAGADPNMRIVPNTPPTEPSPRQIMQRLSRHQYIQIEENYPLYAAAVSHRAWNQKKSRRDELTHWLQAESLVEALLSSGANPFATFRRWTPFNIAEDDKKEDEDEAVRDLLREGRVIRAGLEEVTLIHELLDRNELVHPILMHEAFDASRRDTQHRTLLHMACHKHNLFSPVDALRAAIDKDMQSSLPSFLDCLIDHGADALAIDASGHNLLHHMFLDNQRQGIKEKDPLVIARLTTLYPSLTNQASSSGKTPLHLALKHAVLHGNVAPAKALVAAGADIFTVDKQGNGCLHILAFSLYQSVEIRSLFTDFLQRGMDVNAKNKRGETPIFNLNKHVALFAGLRSQLLTAAEALSLFERAGADLSARDNSDKGLLHVAAKETKKIPNDRGLYLREQVEPPVARYQALLSKGLDPMMEDAQKRTSLDVAAACGKKSILKLFEKDEPVVR
jgi:ankyrin repeat protein